MNTFAKAMITADHVLKRDRLNPEKDTLRKYQQLAAMKDSASFTACAAGHISSVDGRVRAGVVHVL